MTTAAVMALYDTRPLSNRAAWATFDDFLADERIDWAAEPRGLDCHWQKLNSGAVSSPKLWMDGYLAAFAIAGGHQFVTADKAFRRFKGSTWSSCRVHERVSGTNRLQPWTLNRTAAKA